MIVISYSHFDHANALEIKQYIAAKDYSSYLAHDVIEPISREPYEVSYAIRTCDAFVALITSNFNVSEFCQQQIGAADVLRKPIILVQLEPDICVPGFLYNHSLIPQSQLLRHLKQFPRQRKERVESWIRRTCQAPDFSSANDFCNEYRNEWDSMTDDEKARWILAAKRNRNVRASFHGDSIYQREKRKLKTYLAAAIPA